MIVATQTRRQTQRFLRLRESFIYLKILKLYITNKGLK